MRCFLTASLLIMLAACFVLGAEQSSIAGEGIVIKKENGGISLTGKGSGKRTDKDIGKDTGKDSGNKSRGSTSRSNNFPNDYKVHVEYPTATGHEYHCGSNWIMVYLRLMIETEEGVVLDGGFPHCSQRFWKEMRKETCHFVSRKNPHNTYWGEALFGTSENSNRCRFISAEYWVKEHPRRGKEPDKKQ